MEFTGVEAHYMWQGGYGWLTGHSALKMNHGSIDLVGGMLCCCDHRSERAGREDSIAVTASSRPIRDSPSRKKIGLGNPPGTVKERKVDEFFLTIR